MDFRSLATRVASVSVEAGRKKKTKKKTRSKKTTRTRSKAKPKPKKTKTSKPKKPVNPEPIEDPEEIAAGDMTDPKTEYSCQIQMSVTADFEGDPTTTSVNKSQLVKKLKTEIVNQIRAGVGITAREYGLQATQITIPPINVECAVTSN